MIQYGVTEVFVKHRFFSSLRIKILKIENDKSYICEYLGDSLRVVRNYPTTKKLYDIPERMLQVPTDESYKFIYEDGEFSMFRYKYILHVGSSRSSKSWSIEESLIQDCEANSNLRCTVWRDTKASLSETVWKDFKKIIPLSGRYYRFTRNTLPIFFKNGSTIEPHGDDATNAHGLTQDKAWLNEPYRFQETTFNQIDQRCEQIIIDINPTGTHWSDKLVNNPRCMVIYSNFQQNPFCPMEMRLKILSYDPSNPTNVLNKTANLYNWQVYGLGTKAEKPNRIFRWKEIEDTEYHKIEARKYIGVDWGKVDPFGILEAKYEDGRLYLHELNYASENQIRAQLNSDVAKEVERQERDSPETGIVKWLFERVLRIDKRCEVICDTNRPLKGALLRRMGYDVIPAMKPQGSILDGIDLLDNLEVFYTSSSKNIAHEQENYSREVDKFGHVLDDPEDDYNHLIDPTRYIAMRLVQLGIIRRA